MESLVEMLVDETSSVVVTLSSFLIIDHVLGAGEAFMCSLVVVPTFLTCSVVVTFMY